MMTNSKQVLYPLALALLGLLIQGALLRFILPDFTIPNLVLVLVVFLGFFEASPLGAVLAFVIGLGADLCSGVAIGPTAGAYSAVFGVIVALSARLFVDSALAIGISVFLSSIVGNLVFLLLGYHFSLTVGSGASAIVWEAILSAGIAPVLFPFLKRVLLSGRDRPTSRLGSRQRLAAT